MESKGFHGQMFFMGITHWGRQGCRPLRCGWTGVRCGGGGKPPPYGVGTYRPVRWFFGAYRRRDTQVPPYETIRTLYRRG